MRLLKIATTTIMFLAVAGVAYSDDGKRKIDIELIPASQSQVDQLSATAFGISLAGWVSEYKDTESLPVGKYRPTFTALVSALSAQIQIWRELQENEGPGSAYMNTLILIDDSGFLKEYVWANHAKHIVVGEKPKGLREKEFSQWAVAKLTGHVPRIEATLNVRE